jgi:hypothetical protein
MGLDSVAKTFLKLRSDQSVEPIVYDRAGKYKSIKLNRYKLMDGTFAYEYLQMILENNNGQKLYFLGLKTDKRSFDWPAEKMLKKVK